MDGFAGVEFIFKVTGDNAIVSTGEIKTPDESLGISVDPSSNFKMTFTGTTLTINGVIDYNRNIEGILITSKYTFDNRTISYSVDDKGVISGLF